MAPRAGFEPATKRLTAACSTTELPRKAPYNPTHNKELCQDLDAYFVWGGSFMAASSVEENNCAYVL